MAENADSVVCRICGSEIVNIPNPTGPEQWGEDAGNGNAYNYGCLQAAFDQWDGEGDEPEAPYPSHEPETQIDSSAGG